MIFIIRMAGLVVVFGMISLSHSSRSFDDQPLQSVLELPKAVRGESCVAPVEEMRRDHMEMLFHQRDETMYFGVRDARFSLIGCISCHTQTDAEGQFIPINAPGQFCQECHSYTAVKMDCFQCHAATPGQAATEQ